MNWKLCGIGRGLIYDTYSYFTFISLFTVYFIALSVLETKSRQMAR